MSEDDQGPLPVWETRVVAGALYVISILMALIALPGAWRLDPGMATMIPALGFLVAAELTRRNG